jgi:hypothetical protein
VRSWSALAVTLFIGVGAASSFGGVFGPEPIAWGVAVSNPARGGELLRAERLLGEAPGAVLWFQNFDEPLFYDDQLANVRDVGAVPIITWEPIIDGEGVPLVDIIEGKHDDYLMKSAHAAVRAGAPLYIRFAHEMNLQSSPWGPGRDGNTPRDFVKAWRHVVSVFDNAGAADVDWVWSPNVDCGGECPFQAFYPGDRDVDWVGLDGYNFGPSLGYPWRSLDSIFATSYKTITSMSSRPVMIAETASAERGGDKAEWIRQGLLSYVPAHMPRVRLVMWFDRVKETDWRINSSVESLESFQQVVDSRLYTNRIHV